jgi:hypothetical protein
VSNVQNRNARQREVVVICAVRLRESNATDQVCQANASWSSGASVPVPWWFVAKCAHLKQAVVHCTGWPQKKSNLKDEAACTCSYSTNAPTRVCGYVYAEQTRAQSRHTCPSCLAEVHRLTPPQPLPHLQHPRTRRVRVGASDPNPLQCGSVTACRRMQPDHRQGEGQRVRQHESEPGSQRHALLSVALEPQWSLEGQKIEGAKEVVWKSFVLICQHHVLKRKMVRIAGSSQALGSLTWHSNEVRAWLGNPRVLTGDQATCEDGRPDPLRSGSSSKSKWRTARGPLLSLVYKFPLPRFPSFRRVDKQEKRTCQQPVARGLASSALSCWQRATAQRP